LANIDKTKHATKVRKRKKEKSKFAQKEKSPQTMEWKWNGNKSNTEPQSSDISDNERKTIPERTSSLEEPLLKALIYLSI
jgi:hypothetical protein